MNKKLERFSQKFPLTGAGIEELSETLEEKLRLVGVETQNRIRVRFSTEESLLRMRDQFGENTTVTLSMWTRFGRPVLQIEQEGERYNPLSKTEVELEDWSGTLLTAVGLYPQYSYVKGKNFLRLNLPMHRMNPALKILIAIAVGTVLGFLGLTALPEAQQADLVQAVLQPIYELWIRILSVLSGPVIFFMVITTFLNTGGIEEEGGNSKRVTMRYFSYCAAAAMLAGIAACVAAGAALTGGETPWAGASGFLSHLFQIVPEDIFGPLTEANTPQILLIAFMLGNGLVISGARTQGLSLLVRQINTIGLLMADWVSRCVPYFTVALICYEILSREAGIFRWLWQVLLLALMVSLLCMLLVTLGISRQQQVSLSSLTRKLMPAFAKAIKTGGLDAGFGDMQASCVKDLGVERHYVEIGLPMGMTLYMPITVVGIYIFTIYAAVQGNVVISAGWLVVAGILAVVMSAAAPPVPGASLLTYMMLFSELGIPEFMLISAMVFDILFGIFASAANQTMLQLDLIRQADQIGLLDKECLRRS